MSTNTNIPANVPSQTGDITRKDIERAIHTLAYRKEYNQRKEVRANRQLRQERIKIALRYIKEHPEVLG